MYPLYSGDSLLALATTYGLPLFVYDGSAIARQIHELKDAFDVPTLDIRYACKALSTIGILDLIHREGCGIDTVSPGEIAMALKAGIPAYKISFTPSGVHMHEYAAAIEKGIHVHVDQLNVLQWLDQHYPGTAVTLRFNPGVEAGGHAKLRVGATGSKFGFPASVVDQVKKLTDSLSLRITGVHMHLGSDISDAHHFNQAYERLLSFAWLWKDTLTHIDVGGGYKVAYHPEDAVLDMPSFGQSVSRRFTEFCTAVGRELVLVLEPGKFLVSGAGYLLMEVTEVRPAASNPLVYVSSGFNHFVRPMYYDAYHHILNLSNPEGAEQLYDIVGFLCETDTLATQRSLPEVRQGDVLCLLNAGAYGYTMASNYNSRPRPAEILIQKDGTPKLIRRAENLEDLMRTDIGYTKI